MIAHYPCYLNDSQAHAVAYEHHRALLSSVLVFPTSFGRSLLPSIPAGGSAAAPSTHDAIQSANAEITAYPARRIWAASILLIPIHLCYQWVLIAVTNLFDAVPRDYIGPRINDVLPGDSKPDRSPFTILVLNSGRSARTKAFLEVPQRVRSFLELSWEQYRGTKLEFVDSFTVKVCFPDRFNVLHSLYSLIVS